MAARNNLGREPIGRPGLVSVATCNQNNVVRFSWYLVRWQRAASQCLRSISSSSRAPLLLFLLVLFDHFQRCGCELVLLVSAHLLVSIFVSRVVSALVHRYVNLTDRSHIPGVFLLSPIQPLQLYLVFSLGLTITVSSHSLQASAPDSLLAVGEG